MDEPHLHAAPILTYPQGDDRVIPTNYSTAPPPAAPMQTPINSTLIPDPYAAHHPRMPMYPPHQQPGHGYPPPQPRYERPYQQGGYRPRNYSGATRPMRGLHGELLISNL